MSSDPNPVELRVLRAFSPLDGLKKENLAALARKTAIRELPQGRVLFKEGDKEKRTYYLASGEVELLSNGRVIGMIHGGTSDARHPLAPILPRHCTARVASDKIEYLSIDSDLLDVLITWDQTGIYEVGELGASNASSDDWMTMLLQSRAFHRIPPANLQAVFLRLQRMNYSAGDVVIRQGEEGDFFYVIVSGRCSVSRETPLNREGIRLAELGIGETFGEEALISGATRNATVTMLTDGVLMRLAKDDFNTLLNEPMLQWVDYDQGLQIVAKGGTWLDVRLPSEYEHWHLEPSLNVPLYFIRLKIKTLDPAIRYVVVCDNGRRSSAAAYILSERGFDTYVLQGGIATTGLADTLSRTSD
ncbi:MAG: cyclic nucleotide-binding domain-containing protein [Steroidobacteraceae bacterium]|nr:cyclic nucleotide-binding domain-containing protein [Steroidobacteraceae bacterium]MBP7013551.1 cyclic nucleotide-binding domain-containing protein [Steroidobacteraceae bacterium]